MDDTKLFAQDCAEFFKKRLFTPNLKPDDLTARIDAALYIMAQNLLSGSPTGSPTGSPNAPSIAYFIMGTKGGGGPHLEALIHYLAGRHLSPTFVDDMPAGLR